MGSRNGHTESHTYVNLPVCVYEQIEKADCKNVRFIFFGIGSTNVLKNI